jgi:hypothetical protein
MKLLELDGDIYFIDFAAIQDAIEIKTKKGATKVDSIMVDVSKYEVIKLMLETIFIRHEYDDGVKDDDDIDKLIQNQNQNNKGLANASFSFKLAFNSLAMNNILQKL